MLMTESPTCPEGRMPVTRPRTPRELEAAVLLWIARLPLVPASDLTVLNGEPEDAVRRALDGLHRHGWTERLLLRSPKYEYEFEADVLRDAAVPAFAQAFSLDEAEVRRHWPVGRRDLLDRIATFEVTDAVNYALVRMAAECRDQVKVEVLDLRSRPRRTIDRWWPPGVEAYGRLAVGSAETDFFLVWNRAGESARQRRGLVRAWYDAHARTSGWPRLLMVCPSTEQEQAWDAEIYAEAGRREDLAFEADDPDGDVDCDPLMVGVIDPRAAHGEDSLSRWRWLADPYPTDLFEVLGWSSCRRPFAVPGSPRLDLIDRGVEVQAPSLREWAAELIALGQGSARERATAQLLTLEPAQRLALGHLARHPYVTEHQLATTLGGERERAAQLLADLHRRGLTGAIEREQR